MAHQKHYAKRACNNNVIDEYCSGGAIAILGDK